jgi:hypothetical protein
MFIIAKVEEVLQIELYSKRLHKEELIFEPWKRNLERTRGHQNLKTLQI